MRNRNWLNRIVLALGAICLSASAASATGNPALGGTKGFCTDSKAASAPNAVRVSPANVIAPAQTIFNTDFTSAGVGGLRNFGTGTITLAGVSGTVTQALLYWNGPTNSDDPAVNAAITVNGTGFVGTNIGFSHDNCWGFENTQAYVVDVTSLVQGTGNGAYVITGLAASANTVADSANSNGASLIVFFDDGNSTNNRDVVLFHGNDASFGSIYDPTGWNVSLSGINYTAGTANLQLHVADGQDVLASQGSDDDALVLNGTELVPAGSVFGGNTVPSANNGPLNNGNLWDIRNFDVTSFLSPGPNSLTLTSGHVNDCIALIVAIVDLPAGAAPNECDVKFDPLPNWPLFCDYYSKNAQYMFNNTAYPIQPGDVIHATDPQGVICGLTTVAANSAGSYLIHVLGDDPKTAEDEGAVPGDSITLWLNCDCPVVATNTWVNFGSFQYDALWDCEECNWLCGTVYSSECVNKDGCCLDGATIELWSSYPDGVLLSSTEADWGKFCFSVVPGEHYDVRVWLKGYCTEVVDNWSCEDGPLSIYLDPVDFVPLPNWPYFTDYYSTQATFEGFPIQPGDVIYATDPQGVKCGVCWVTDGGTYLIHVLGDDPKTIEDEGAVTGDSITLWLNCECSVVAPDGWANYGNFRFDAAWDCRPTGLCCTLCEGWNMWSYNILMPNYARESVLATIDLNYDAVRSGLCDYGSISWFANRPVNDLENVTPWYGYDIHMLAEDTVCIEGQVIDPATPIYLCEGWNYIPYLPMESDALSHALESLDGNYAHIFTMFCGYGAASWNESRPEQNNDLICLEPCHGYWIKMKSDDTLIYPSGNYGCLRVAKLAANSVNGHVTPTPMVADYYAAASNLLSGDRISVRTSSGALIGECTVGADGAFLIHVYGDVPQTQEVEGATQGQALTFQVNGLAASAHEDILWYDRDNRAIDLTVSGASSVPTDYALLQNYPNPFNAGTVLPFVLKNASDWNLAVFNVMGQTVQTFSGHGEGLVRVTWNGRSQDGASVPSGVYFYRVSTSEWSATKKMTLLK